MEDKTTAFFHDSAADNGRESPLNAENVDYSPESQEVQGELQAAADDTGGLGSGDQGSRSGAISKETVKDKKRGRGRPRKHDGVSNVQSREAFPPPTASSPPSSVPGSSTKRPRGRPKGSGKFQALASHGGYMDTAGGSFTPHVLLVLTGEDVASKIATFCGRGPRSICILTACGAVSSVTLYQPGSSLGTLTFEGRFEILTLTGSSVLSGEPGTRRKNSMLSISLANSHGRVFGGSVVGPLIAAGPGPIQLIVASFKQNISTEIRRRYSVGCSASANTFSSSQMINVPIQVAGMEDDDENYTPPPSSPPAPVTVRADPVKADAVKSDKVVADDHNFNSTSPENVGPSNLQKADPVKNDNTISENQDLNSTSLQSVGPYNLQTLPVSQPISDAMITQFTKASNHEMHLND